MIYLYAFLIGGLICGIAEVIQTLFKLTPGHVTGIFVIVGVFLDFFNFYDKLIEIAGAGALLPITSFGHSLVDAAMKGANEHGFIGIFTGVYSSTSAGIALAIVLSVFAGLFFKPRS